MIFSEDSRVKIPCILHLARLGYVITSYSIHYTKLYDDHRHRQDNSVVAETGDGLAVVKEDVGIKNEIFVGGHATPVVV